MGQPGAAELRRRGPTDRRATQLKARQSGRHVTAERKHGANGAECDGEDRPGEVRAERLNGPAKRRDGGQAAAQKGPDRRALGDEAARLDGDTARREAERGAGNARSGAATWAERRAARRSERRDARQRGAAAARQQRGSAEGYGSPANRSMTKRTERRSGAPVARRVERRNEAGTGRWNEGNDAERTDQSRVVRRVACDDDGKSAPKVPQRRGKRRCGKGCGSTMDGGRARPRPHRYRAKAPNARSLNADTKFSGASITASPPKPSSRRTIQDRSA
jgi:hypothetical protein